MVAQVSVLAQAGKPGQPLYKAQWSSIVSGQVVKWNTQIHRNCEERCVPGISIFVSTRHTNKLKFLQHILSYCLWLMAHQHSVMHLGIKVPFRCIVHLISRLGAEGQWSSVINTRSQSKDKAGLGRNWKFLDLASLPQFWNLPSFLTHISHKILPSATPTHRSTNSSEPLWPLNEAPGSWNAS